ncbi:hypothetical protein CJ030_MR7G011570 [Morella rubra]|uniref:GRF-type domain-containing protein n=1 Tax=Morella rubra TaxID=262757 RepID=A0A6A1V3F9_9ROSI|nr:hypothetical protein CJ030_MR7G011570 [Morella rubra]
MSEGSHVSSGMPSSLKIRQQPYEIKFCSCGLRAPLISSWTDSNPGRRFFGCANYGTSKHCGYFCWFDPRVCPRGMEVGLYWTKRNKELQKENDALKRTVRRLKCIVGASLVAVTVMGAFFIRIF